MRRALIAAVLCLSAACHRGTTSFDPAPRSAWSSTFTQASQEATAGRYGVADRMLAEYTTQNPATSDATEAMYWRAVYKLDPANQAGSTRDAGVLLDSYLASSSAPHRTEALALRRIATALEARSPSVAPAVAATPKTDVPTDKAKDDEIQRLKDELAKSNAELERIKRRLAQPKP